MSAGSTRVCMPIGIARMSSANAADSAASHAAASSSNLMESNAPPMGAGMPTGDPLDKLFAAMGPQFMDVANGGGALEEADVEDFEGFLAPGGDAVDAKVKKQTCTPTLLVIVGN